MELVKKLCHSHDREYAYITGSGTSAIYIALRALGLKNKYIGIPNNVCFDVPLGIIYSGNSPFFLDIERETLGLSVVKLKKYLGAISGVIAVHSYGSICNIESITECCQKYGIPLIEDCAVAQGAKFNNKPVGSFGDISLLSFGAGKIIDVGHGGALLTNDQRLYKEFMAIDKKLDQFSNSKRDRIEHLSSFHTGLYNRYYTNGQYDQCSQFLTKAKQYKDSYLYRFSPFYEQSILMQLDQLTDNISMRKLNAYKVMELFEDTDELIDVFVPREGSVIWRFNIFVKNRNNLLKHLLKEKYKVSSWYPSVDFFCGLRRNNKNDTPISDWVGEHILNIWVNREIDNLYLQGITQEIKKFVRDQHGEQSI